MPNTIPVLVMSDGTGETGARLLSAVARQFTGNQFVVRRKTHLVTVDRLPAAFADAAASGAIIVGTFVKSDVRRRARELADKAGLLYIDALENLMAAVDQKAQGSAIEVPNLLHRTDEAYFKRIEAIEFTIRADDGQDPRMLRNADVVLVGVSRTSKTPLSTFLAHKGYKVANQPLILGRPAPAALFDVDPDRVFALTIDDGALQRIRESRLAAMQIDKANYSDIDYILAEQEYAQDLFQGNQWTVIDVTNKALEETATTIIDMMRERGFPPPYDPYGA